MHSETSALGVQNIKIPLLIKIYGFFIFLITLINFLFLDFVYAFHGIGKYFFIFLVVAILWLGYSFSVYKYIKKPSIGIGRLQKGVLLLFISLDFFSIFKVISSHRDLEFKIGVILIGIILFFIIIKALIFDRFSKINKILKNSENFSDEKYYSEKSQEKGLIKTFGIFFVGLIIFYFTYYTTPPIEFKKVSDSYFDDSELYKNVDSEENGYNILEKYEYGKDFKYNEKNGNPYKSNFSKEYQKTLDEIKKIENSEENKEYYDKYFKKELSNFNNTENPKKNIFSKFDKNQLKLIDLKRIKREKIYNAKYYISPFINYRKSQREITSTTKNTIYNVKYYLKNNQEKKALEYLIVDYKYSKLLLNGYSTQLDKIIGLTSIAINGRQINYILDNYNLSKENLVYLKNNIKNIKVSKKAYENMKIYEYNGMKKALSSINGNPFKLGKVARELDNEKNSFKDDFLTFKNLNVYNLNGIFLNGNYLKEITKNTFYYLGKENYINNVNYCDISNKINRNQILKNMFLKKNGYFDMMGIITCRSFRGDEEEFKNIQKQEKELLEKIDMKIKEAEKREKNIEENGEKEEKINKKVLEFFKKK